MSIPINDDLPLLSSLLKAALQVKHLHAPHRLYIACLSEIGGYQLPDPALQIQ